MKRTLIFGVFDGHAVRFFSREPNRLGGLFVLLKTAVKGNHGAAFADAVDGDQSDRYALAAVLGSRVSADR